MIGKNITAISNEEYIDLGIGISPMTTSRAYLPEDTYIGSKSIEDIIDQKVQEKIRDNLDKVATRLPTDIALGEREFLIIKVEVGDMPKEAKEIGLSKVVLYPSYNGVGEMQYSSLDIEDKIIE